MTWRIYRRPSDSADPMPEEKVVAEDAPVAAEAPPAADPMAQLQEELTAAKAQLEQWHDRFLRKAAELDNYRKRMEKDRQESSVLAKSSVLIEFLPIVDACERALESFNSAQETTEGLELYRDGVQLLYKQMVDTLTRVGVVPIATVGRSFDPHLHEALSREATWDHEENTILKELRRGYLFGDRLLRPAQVRVASRPKGEDSGKSDL